MVIIKKWRSTLMSFLIILLIGLISFPILSLPEVFATELDEKRDELQDTTREIDEAKDDIRGAKSREQELESKIESLEEDIAAIQRELTALSQRIEQTETEITTTEAELQEAEEKLRKQEDFLGNRLRAIHEMGDINYLEVVFEASSFVEFLSRFNNLQLIVEEDVRLLEVVQREREEIVRKKAELEDKKSDLLTMRRQTLEKKEQVEQQVSRRERLLQDIKVEIEKQERIVKQLEKESKEIREMIRKLEEEARRQAGRGEVGQLLWPLSEFGRGWITSPYGFRTHPIFGRRTFHTGVDIGIPRSRWPGSSSFNGNPVYIRAVADGTAFLGRSTGFGNYVVVVHGSGLSTMSAHAHRILVTSGQEVRRGQAIAIVGSTGWSTGPHIHFEVWKNNKHQNPMAFFR